ncbi:MAG: DAK2 domain-containing protein [SAR202 cluster bacterium]|nr:DAK2 domain-containing protein [SAR202 cluster bacterium]
MDQIRGQDLKQAFTVATAYLEEYRDTVNALNVFPVPDGDTGTNMLLTMRSAVQSVTEGCPDGQEHSVARVSSALAQGAFFGAKGNSGVILSQFFKGFSDALAGKESLAADDLSLAFKLASNAAYQSVGNPVEGTMLTVIRMASEAVQGSAAQGSNENVLGLWEAAFQASQDALSHTPEQLPVLREAGVVDAGGLGIVVLIGGALQSLAPLVDISALSRFQRAANGSATGLIAPGFLESTLEQDWGNCTQFIISGPDLDLDAVRTRFQETALSTVVVGDGHNIRVHIHVENTGPALAYAESQGALSDIKIENMDYQNQLFASRHQANPAKGAALALLPVTLGAGLAHLFRESGCAAVIQGGQTMNPSVQQILDAVHSTGANDIIVLPNNANVILAAEQAAASEPCIHVVPTKSIPQGVAALLVFNPEESWEENVDAMTAALAEVASVEVTRAVRDANINGVSVTEGQFIGLLEGQMVTAAETPEIALRIALDQAGLSAEAIVTIYHGAGTPISDAESVAASLNHDFPGIQVDLIDGGQPNYQYLASVE